MTYGIRNRKIALAQVARHVAGMIAAGSLEEATGIPGADFSEHSPLTRAEEDRLAWAMEEVERRLYALSRDVVLPGEEA